MFLVLGESRVDLSLPRGAQRQPALVEPGEERGGVADPVGGVLAAAGVSGRVRLRGVPGAARSAPRPPAGGAAGRRWCVQQDAPTTEYVLMELLLRGRIHSLLPSGRYGRLRPAAAMHTPADPLRARGIDDTAARLRADPLTVAAPGGSITDRHRLTTLSRREAAPLRRHFGVQVRRAERGLGHDRFPSSRRAPEKGSRSRPAMAHPAGKCGSAAAHRGRDGRRGVCGPVLRGVGVGVRRRPPGRYRDRCRGCGHALAAHRHDCCGGRELHGREPSRLGDRPVHPERRQPPAQAERQRLRGRSPLQPGRALPRRPVPDALPRTARSRRPLADRVRLEPRRHPLHRGHRGQPGDQLHHGGPAGQVRARRPAPL